MITFREHVLLKVLMFNLVHKNIEQCRKDSAGHKKEMNRRDEGY